MTHSRLLDAQRAVATDRDIGSHLPSSYPLVVTRVLGDQCETRPVGTLHVAPFNDWLGNCLTIVTRLELEGRFPAPEVFILAERLGILGTLQWKARRAKLQGDTVTLKLDYCFDWLEPSSCVVRIVGDEPQEWSLRLVPQAPSGAPQDARVVVLADARPARIELLRP